MIKYASIIVALAGLAVLLHVAYSAVSHRGAIPPLWEGCAGWMMAAGLLGLNFAVNRERRAQVRSDLNR